MIVLYLTRRIVVNDLTRIMIVLFLIKMIIVLNFTSKLGSL